MARHKFIPYNTALTTQARENRKNQSFAEKKFWFEILKSEPFAQYKFNRQKPLLDYMGYVLKRERDMRSGGLYAKNIE